MLRQATSSTTMALQTLILDKGERKYVFRYTPGSEGQVMDQLWRLAEDASTDLDWLDAAALTFQVLCQAAMPGVPGPCPGKRGPAYRHA